MFKIQFKRILTVTKVTEAWCEVEVPEVHSGYMKNPESLKEVLVLRSDAKCIKQEGSTSESVEVSDIRIEGMPGIT